MSREVPLLASEKIKLGIIIVLCAAIVIPGIITGWKAIYKNIVKDTEGYEKKMEEVEKTYKFKVVSYNEKQNSYDLDIDAEQWKGLSKNGRFQYCEACLRAIRQTQWYYKITDEGDDPVIQFYINNSMVAKYAYDQTTLY